MWSVATLLILWTWRVVAGANATTGCGEPACICPASLGWSCDTAVRVQGWGGALCACSQCDVCGVSVAVRPMPPVGACGNATNWSTVRTFEALRDAIEERGCAEVVMAAGAQIAMSNEVCLVAETTLVGLGATFYVGVGEHRVFQVRSVTTMENLTLANGLSALGGCVYVAAGASLTARNVVFRNCTATWAGGGIASISSFVALAGHSVISAGVAMLGGGIASFSGIVDVAGDSRLEHCHAQSEGGGLYSFLGAISVVDRARIVSCSALVLGGAIQGTASTAKIGGEARVEHCYALQYGGGVALQFYSWLEIGDTARIVGCSAVFGGGIVVISHSRAEIKGEAAVVGCQAFTGGAGMLVSFESELIMKDDASILDCVVTMDSDNGGGGGAALYGDGSSLVLQDRARIARCSSWQGGGVVVNQVSTVVLVDDARVTGCVADGDGGGIMLASAAKLTMKRRSEIDGCSAGGSGGGVHGVTTSVVQLADAARIRNCIAVTGDGGGVRTSGMIFLGEASAVEANTALLGNGGGVATANTVSMHLGGRIASNVASHGGGVHVSSAGRLVAASTCVFVEVTLDFTKSELPLGEAWTVLVAEDDSSQIDATGESTLLQASEDSIVTMHSCLAANRTYRLDLVSERSESWLGGTATLSFVQHDGWPTLGPFTVDKGSHVWSTTFTIPSADGGCVPTFEDNVATLGAGGGAHLEDGSEMYLVDGIVAGNSARNGGGISAVQSRVSVFRSTVENNTASSQGGGARMSHISSLYAIDVVARGNVAGSVGGFAKLTYASASEIRGSTIAANRVLSGGGGAVSVEETSLTVQSTSFVDNVVFGSASLGGAVLLMNAGVGFRGVDFRRNAAVDGNGGGLAITGETSTASFSNDSCTIVDVVIDMTASGPNQTCGVIDFLDQGYTCDYWPQGCTLVSSSGYDCAHCACWQNSPLRYVDVTLDDQVVLRALPRSGAIFATSTCLPRVERKAWYVARAWDLAGAAMYGATIRVNVHEASVLKQYDVPALVQGSTASSPLYFQLDDNDDSPLYQPCVFDSNRAPSGGGGAVYWTVKAPEFIEGVEHFGNRANYGDFIATPPVALASTNQAKTTLLTSGEAITDPIVVELLDHYGQRTSSINDAATLLSLEEEVASQANDIAVFVGGVASFDHLSITHTPGASLNASISVLLDYDISLDYAFSIRVCADNEFFENDRCVTCPAGRYLKEGTATCFDCPKGVDCSDAGSSLTTLDVKKGYYRAAPTAETVYGCVAGRACRGGVVAGGASCAKGHEGIWCASCSKSYYLRWQGRCHKCDEQSRTFIYVAGTVVGLAVVLFGFAMLGSKALCSSIIHVASTQDEDVEVFAQSTNRGSLAPCDRLPHRDRSGDERRGGLSRLESFLIQVKALCAFFQVLSSLPTHFRIVFSKTFESVAAVANIFNLVTLALPMSCVGDVNTARFYIGALYVQLVSPVVLLVVIFGAWLAKTTYLRATANKRAERHMFVTVYLLFLYFVLPSVSVAAFRGLACAEIDFGEDEPRLYLEAAPTISCTSRRWRAGIRPIAALAVLAYPVGVPLLYAILLFRGRKILNPKLDIAADFRGSTAWTPSHICRSRSTLKIIKRSPLVQRAIHQHRTHEVSLKHDDLVHIIRFLWVDYLSHSYWWEVCETLRRIFLGAIIFVIAPGTAGQLAVAYVVSAAFACAVMIRRPLANEYLNDVVITSQLCTSGALFVALLRRADSLSVRDSSIIALTICCIPACVIIAVVALFFTTNRLPGRDRRASFQSKTPNFDTATKSSITPTHCHDSGDDGNEGLDDDKGDEGIVNLTIADRPADTKDDLAHHPPDERPAPPPDERAVVG